jgi:hypothetical protein
MRNSLGDMKIILDANGGKIEWRFIEQLHNLQDKEDLRPGNKLQNSYIMCHKRKMKVLWPLRR